MSNDSNFDSLFTPFSIGKMEIKNRLVMSPMGTYAALMDGSVSDALGQLRREILGSGDNRADTALCTLFKIGGQCIRYGAVH